MIALLAEGTQVSDKNQAFFRGLRDGITSTYDPTEAAIFWSAAILLIVVIAIVARVCTRRETQAVEPRKEYLPVVVDLLGLSEDDRRTLAVVARAAQLVEPAVMLLTPQNLAKAVGALDEGAQARMADSLESIRRRMFGAAVAK